MWNKWAVLAVLAVAVLSAHAAPVVLESDSAVFSLTMPDADFDGVLDSDDPNPTNPDSDGDGIPDGADGDIVDIQITSTTHPDPSAAYPLPDATFHVSTEMTECATYKYFVDSSPITRVTADSPAATSVSFNPSTRDITCSVETAGTYYFHIAGAFRSGVIASKTSTRAFRVSARYVVPNVVGMPQSEAETALTAAGLTLGTITQEWNDAPSGEVLTQSVSPGATMQEVGPVALTVSRGKVTDSYKYGDVNMDGVIDSADYGRMMALGTNPSPEEKVLADVTHDGSITAADRKLLMQFLRSGGLVNATVRRLMVQAGGNEVLLLWAPIPYDNVAKYRVYRSEDAAESKTWTLLNDPSDDPADTVFSDKSVESTTYFYRVSFVDILGNESGYSTAKDVVANTIIMSIPAVWGKAGDTVRVPINLGNARGLTPNAMFIPFQYDPSIATLTAANIKATALTAGIEFLALLAAPGSMNIMSEDTQAKLPSGEGRFFDIYMTLKADAPNGCKALTLGDVVLKDSDDNDIQVMANPGSLCVGEGTWGDIYPEGGDGKVTEEDAETALKITVEELVLEDDDPRWLFGDLNGDGMIDAADAVIILRMAQALPINPATGAKDKAAKYSPRQITLGEVSTAKGCTATVPVTVDDVSALAGMDLVISFPRQDLECTDVRTTAATTAFKLDKQIAPGYARISLGEAQALGGGEAAVLELDFRLTGEPSTTQNPAPVIKLNYAELKGELGESFRWYGDVTKQNAMVTILPQAECPVQPEGQPAEGEVPDGQGPDGQVPDGQTPDGQAPDGQNAEGQSAAEGEVPATDGQPPATETPVASNGCACAGTNPKSGGPSALLFCLAFGLSFIPMRRISRIGLIGLISLIGLASVGHSVIASAPGLTNVSVTPRDGNAGIMDIQYDLTDDTGLPYTVSAFLSTDNGATYPIELTAVSGDIGDSIQPGAARQIAWTWTGDLMQNVAQAKIRIRAERPEAFGPVAAFNADITTGVAPLTVHFTDQSTENTLPIASWAWDFGDGSATDEEQNPTHVYDTAGTYPVSLTVANAVGSDTAAQSDYITVYGQPSVTSFSINNGAETTTSTTVTLNNVSTAATHYMASESASFVGASWQTYSIAPSFTLSDGVGEKTVYFKVKNAYDESDPISDTIELVSSAEHVAGEQATFAGIAFRWCPPGTFMMGRYSGEQDSSSAEDPQHQVTLSKGFWMSETEVTQAQWVAIMGSNPSHFTGDTSRPVETVSWNDICTPTTGYLAKLNAANPGNGFRLPTEAEWEYAYRAGTMLRFYWGDDASHTQIGSYSWYSGNSSGTTHPVGQKTANAWGLKDMSGNVWEWCADLYESYASGAATDPTGPVAGSNRVVRGGSWDNSDYSCRAACRYGNGQGNTGNGLGLRVVVPSGDILSEPLVSSFSINNGAVSATPTTVTLNNTCTGDPTHYMASESASFVGASWQTYSIAPSFTLSDGVGEKTVYFKVKNAYDESDPISDTIELVDSGEHVAGEQATFAGIAFRWCPPGTFMMGRYSGEQDSSSTEDPQHQVTLSKGFWMSETEVTQAQWVVVMGSNPSTFTGDTSRPVDHVSWNDICTASTGYLARLNAANPGNDFRLPTEAEWEYAYRAGTTQRFYWGDDPNYAQIGTYAWFDGNSSSTSHPVGTKTANAWGLKDMSGNVWEWCADWHGSYASDAATDPTGATSGSERVLRGGSCDVPSGYCRAAIRGKRTPSNGNNPDGFRVVVPGGGMLSYPVVSMFAINNGAASATSTTVTLNNTCTGDPTQYMASESASFVGASWQTYSTAPSFTLSDGEGAKTVYFKVKNGTGESTVSNDAIDLILPPAITSFSINSSAASTISQTVTLNNVCTNAPTHYMASESGAFGGAIWQDYSAAPEFTLSAGGGAKTVYFKVRNAAATTDSISDTITLIVAPGVSTFSINNGASTAVSATVTLNNTCTESPAEYMASEFSSFSGATWQMYNFAPGFTLSGGSGLRTIYFKVRNAAGESNTMSDTITLTGTPTISSFSINSGAATCVGEQVTLDSVCGGSPEQYMASESSQFDGATWQTYVSSAPFTLTAGVGPRTVYFKVKNGAGESPSASDSIELVPLAGERAILAGMAFRWCPPGTFMMGRYSGEQDSDPDEDPQHQVTLSKGFWMSETEVTQAHWMDVMGSNPSSFTGDLLRPVEMVSWNDICATTSGFLDKAEAKYGLAFNLPTEAQWEYAYRAGTTQRFYWGDDLSYTQIGNYAWYSENSSNTTYPVGTKTANSWGLKDMSGNVWEWCSDWSGSYSSGAVTDPSGPGTGDYRVLRGGGFNAYPDCRAANRLSRDPYSSHSSRGFRVIVTPPTSMRRLTMNTTGSGSVSYADYYADGDTATLAPIAESGWRFDHWEGDLTGTNVIKTLTMSADKTVTAVFVEFTPQTATFAGIEFCWCPPGTFMMGSPDAEVGRGADETLHQVTISQGFWMSKTEITQKQWLAIMGSNPSHFSGDTSRPVEQVSWNDICTPTTGYLAKLNVVNPGNGLRLPTEAEWEYAYRAGTATRFYWGDDPSYTQVGNYAWYGAYYGGNSAETTYSVGLKLSNAWGLKDMGGNAWEWCSDWYGDYPSGAVTDPTGAGSGTLRVLRGGSWQNYVTDCRAATRNDTQPNNGWNDYGFRVVYQP